MRRDVSRQRWLGSNEVSEAAAAVCFILAGNEVPSRGRLAASTRNRVCSLRARQQQAPQHIQPSQQRDKELVRSVSFDYCEAPGWLLLKRHSEWRLMRRQAKSQIWRTSKSN
jgi:hypothetical protein